VGEALVPFVRECRAAFQQAGFVPFDGLLARARDLVRDHRHVREAPSRFATLIDEPGHRPIQYEILFFLSEEPGTGVGLRTSAYSAAHCSSWAIRSSRLRFRAYRGVPIGVRPFVKAGSSARCRRIPQLRRGPVGGERGGRTPARISSGMQAAYVDRPRGRRDWRPMVRIIAARRVSRRGSEADGLAGWRVGAGRVEVRGGWATHPVLGMQVRCGAHRGPRVPALRRRDIPYVVDKSGVFPRRRSSMPSTSAQPVAPHRPSSGSCARLSAG
jgi:hypothetical protein